MVSRRRAGPTSPGRSRRRSDQPANAERLEQVILVSDGIPSVGEHAPDRIAADAARAHRPPPDLSSRSGTRREHVSARPPGERRTGCGGVRRPGRQRGDRDGRRPRQAPASGAGRSPDRGVAGRAELAPAGRAARPVLWRGAGGVRPLSEDRSGPSGGLRHPERQPGSRSRPRRVSGPRSRRTASSRASGPPGGSAS